MRGHTRRVARAALSIALVAVTALVAQPAAPSRAAGSVPTPTVTGPVRSVEGSHPWFATEIDLARRGYVEQEFFLEGDARTYDGSEVTGASPYKSRIVVRRPVSETEFSGVVVVEWLNVSSGYDVEFDWFSSHEFFMRRGWAWIGVSAQAVGVNHLRLWDNERYGSLQVSDEQSADIFAQAAKALTVRIGADPMNGLRPRMLIADGHSQSATKVADYHNNQQLSDGLFDAFMVRGQIRPLRDDVQAKVFRLLSETDVWQVNQHRQGTVGDVQGGAGDYDAPDSDSYRRWEVAGASHVTWSEHRQISSLLQREGLPWAPSVCVKPPYSRVPFHHVQNAAYHHLEQWVSGRGSPPMAPRIHVDESLTMPRDEHGFAIDGIRLPDVTAPTALQTGENTGAVSCILYGSRESFSHDELITRYPDRLAYVYQVEAAIRDSMNAGFMLPADAYAVCLAALRVELGWPEPQPILDDRTCRQLEKRTTG